MSFSLAAYTQSTGHGRSGGVKLVNAMMETAVPLEVARQDLGIEETLFNRLVADGTIPTQQLHKTASSAQIRRLRRNGRIPEKGSYSHTFPLVVKVVDLVRMRHCGLRGAA